MEFNPVNPRIGTTEGADESRDCVVRALSLSCNVSYPTAHAVCKAAGRKARHGMWPHQTAAALEALTDGRVSKLTTYGRARPTFAVFAKNNPAGHFIVIKRGHAVALIDGVYHDMNKTGCGARCRVVHYARVR